MKCWSAVTCSLVSRSCATIGGRRPSSSLAKGIRSRVVAPFLIKSEEAVEADHLPIGTQIKLATAGFGENIDSRSLELGRFHLTRHRADPDKLVEPQHVRIERACDVLRQAAEIGRPNRLVRFLRVFSL